MALATAGIPIDPSMLRLKIAKIMTHLLHTLAISLVIAISLYRGSPRVPYVTSRPESFRVAGLEYLNGMPNTMYKTNGLVRWCQPRDVGRRMSGWLWGFTRFAASIKKPRVEFADDAHPI